MNEPSVEVEAPTFEEAVREAATRLGVEPGALGLNVIDAGRSADSSGGFRSVKLRAWVRPPNAAPDGARPGSGSGFRPRATEERRGRGVGRPRTAPESYGPPPPPLYPENITPEHVERARSFAAGIVDAMGFPAETSAEKTKHGIRISIAAGDRDPLLIGPDGDTRGAIQYLVSRRMRTHGRE